MSQGRGCGDKSFLNKSNPNPVCTTCNTFLQKLTSVLAARSCSQTPGDEDEERHVGLTKAETTTEEQQEAAFVQRVYGGDIHVAVVAPASKTPSFWCGFTQIQHHKILHCGFMYGCRCKDINRRSICAGICVYVRGTS